MMGVVCPWCNHEFPWGYMRSEFVKFRKETWDNLCYCTNCHGKFTAAPNPEIILAVMECWGPKVGEDGDGFEIYAISEYDEPMMVEQDFGDNEQCYRNQKIFGKKFDPSFLEQPKSGFDSSTLFADNKDEVFDRSVLSSGSSFDLSVLQGD